MRTLTKRRLAVITEQKLKVLELYNEALALYKQRKWQEAMDGFKKVLAVDAEDGPSNMYIGRCEEYLKHPPEADWDGVFVMKTK